MSWDAALTALSAQLLTLSGIDSSKIQWPNRAFTPSGSFWRVSFLPATVQPELGGTKDHERGIFQVSRFVPAGTGIGPAIREAQTVVDLFKRQVLSGVSCGVPTLAPPISEPEWLHIPVSIPFQVL